VSEDFDQHIPDDLNFFEELERLAGLEVFQPFTLSLIDGSRFDVTSNDRLATFRTMYVLYTADGRQVMFPFSNVCHLEVHPID
jgi:hypothetical protein